MQIEIRKGDLSLVVQGGDSKYREYRESFLKTTIEKFIEMYEKTTPPEPIIKHISEKVQINPERRQPGPTEGIEPE